MSNKNIVNNTELVNFLLDETKPISDRLKKYNEYNCLAFVKSPKWFFNSFKDLFDSEEKIKAFEVAKQNSINEITEKRANSSYEEFLRYLFFDLEKFDDSYGEQIYYTTPDSLSRNEPFIYNIVPKDKDEVEILKKVTIEHVKKNEGNVLGRHGATRVGQKIVIAYNSLETLKARLNSRLKGEFTDREAVINDCYEKYIAPLNDTTGNSRPQRIYRNIKKGLRGYDESYYYCYFKDELAVIELIKFEQYLNEIKNNPNNESQIKDIELPEGFEKFSISSDMKPFISEIYKVYKGVTGKDMAILVYVLHDEKIINYKKNSKTGVSRKNLAQCFNRNINDVLLRQYFNTAQDNELYNPINKTGSHFVYEDDIQKVRKQIKLILEDKVT